MSNRLCYLNWDGLNTKWCITKRGRKVRAWPDSQGGTVVAVSEVKYQLDKILAVESPSTGPAA